MQKFLRGKNKKLEGYAKTSQIIFYLASILYLCPVLWVQLLDAKDSVARARDKARGTLLEFLMQEEQ